MRHFARDHRLLITLPLLLVMLAIVPALTMGLTWVRQVGLLSADAVVFASDAPAMDRFMARAMKGVYGDRVQICDGTADDVELQAAVNALTQGGRILYSGGTFHPSTYITMSASDNLPMCFEGRGDSTTFSFSRGDLAPSVSALFTNVPDTVATYNSWSNDVGSTSGGAFGVQTAYWQLDAAGGTNDYVGIIIDDADGTGAVGTLYVTVMGQ